MGTAVLKEKIWGGGVRVYILHDSRERRADHSPSTW